MKRPSLISLLACLVAVPAFAQPPDSPWSRTFAVPEIGGAYSIQQTIDGSQIFAGHGVSSFAGEDEAGSPQDSHAGGINLPNLDAPLYGGMDFKKMKKAIPLWYKLWAEKLKNGATFCFVDVSYPLYLDFVNGKLVELRVPSVSPESDFARWFSQTVRAFPESTTVHKLKYELRYSERGIDSVVYESWATDYALWRSGTRPKQERADFWILFPTDTYELPDGMLVRVRTPASSPRGVMSILADSLMAPPPPPPLLDKMPMQGQVFPGTFDSIRSMVPDSLSPGTPPQLLNSPQPKYPDKARENGLTGKVIVKMYVDTNGKVQKWEFVKVEPTGFGFATEVEKLIKQWRFKPALRNGQPEGCWVAIPFNFEFKK